jgi:hypothetical protein
MGMTPDDFLRCYSPRVPVVIYGCKYPLNEVAYRGWSCIEGEYHNNPDWGTLLLIANDVVDVPKALIGFIPGALHEEEEYRDLYLVFNHAT